MVQKRALLVGINTYPSSPLRGCVNDVNEMKLVLQEFYGFKNITMLTDNAATTKAILSALNELVANAGPGDILYFHYSGHGSQYPNTGGNDVEPDGLDEIICPVDLNWNDKMIRDDDLRAIFDNVPKGVNLTVTLDCCNSGTALDQTNQYQPLGPARSGEKEGGRYLPPPAAVMQLTESRQLTFNKERSLTHRDVNETGLLLSGCQSHQTSADAYIGGRYMGACTYFLIDVLKENNGGITYRTLAEEVNKKIANAGYAQRPELNGSMGLFEYNYLAPMGKPEVVEPPVVEPPVVEPPVVEPPPTETETPDDVVIVPDTPENSGNSNDDDDDDSGNKKIFIVLGLIALIAIAFFFS